MCGVRRESDERTRLARTEHPEGSVADRLERECSRVGLRERWQRHEHRVREAMEQERIGSRETQDQFPRPDDLDATHCEHVLRIHGVRAEQRREQVLTEERRSVRIEGPEQRGSMIHRGHGRAVMEAVVTQEEAVGQPVILDRPGRRRSGRDRTVWLDVDKTIEHRTHDQLPLVISEVARVDGRGITTEPDTDGC